MIFNPFGTVTLHATCTWPNVISLVTMQIFAGQDLKHSCLLL